MKILILILIHTTRGFKNDKLLLTLDLGPLVAKTATENIMVYNVHANMQDSTSESQYQKVNIRKSTSQRQGHLQRRLILLDLVEQTNCTSRDLHLNYMPRRSVLNKRAIKQQQSLFKSAPKYVSKCKRAQNVLTMQYLACMITWICIQSSIVLNL